MTRCEIAVVCDVCHEPTHQIYFNPVLLGRDDVFCRFCYLAWHESRLTNEEQIRRRSLQQRYEEDAPCPC